ncbi:MAG: anti-sigma regulatory factor [Verrucomicrobia bacterium]|nr:anti-sigma regulatory factor [Verrucomicrobiota bacterium]MDE3099433.1 anti-sigma regulatory factor [Verrucomicrobiota bacterium]
MESHDSCVEINSAADIVEARRKGRELAAQIGFDGSDLTVIAAAISEIARNIVDHARRGRVFFSSATHGNRRGICIVAKDEGPGIKDVARAMQYGYSTRKGLGVGLPGAKWLMDDFEIDTKIGVGTVVTMKKWLR